METGAEGICVPHIKTADEAQNIISACLYPPAGIRGASGFTRATSYGLKEFKGHTEQANEDLFICLLIESVEGLSNLQIFAKLSELTAFISALTILPVRQILRTKTVTKYKSLFQRL